MFTRLSLLCHCGSPETRPENRIKPSNTGGYDARAQGGHGRDQSGPDWDGIWLGSRRKRKAQFRCRWKQSETLPSSV